ARFHDLGKARKVWQQSIGNRNYPKEVLAKSGGTMKPTELNDYRHEFGSLLDIQKEPEFTSQPDHVRDLILHLIATHPGRGRPCFADHEAFDPERSEAAAVAVAREVPTRFARLQRKYGRWGLAYLESLLRAADAEASANPTGGEA